MFQNKSVFNDEEASIAQQNFSQEKDLKIKDVMIHTMAKDIAEKEHPTAQAPTESESVDNIANTQTLTEKQQSSPFLNSVIPTAPKSSQKTEVSAKKINAPANNNFAVTLIVIAVIVLIAGAGIYYFNVTRQGNVAVVEPTPALIIPEEPIVPLAPKFSSDKPTYLSLDIDNLTTVQIKEALHNLATEIKSAELTAPIEFIVTDSQNNPVDFTIFSQKIGLTLSENVLSKLDPTFNLFVFNDGGNMRLGLAITTIDNATLKRALLLEEPLLAKNLDAILLVDTDHEFSTAAFSETVYNKIAIRYQNIISPEELSIDYAIDDTQLIIGTTKETMFSIMDKIALETATAPATTTMPSTGQSANE